MSGFLNFVISRFLQLVVTMFIVSVLVFFMVRLRGDPVLVMAPPMFDQEQIDHLRAFWGFDRPLGEQYVTFLAQSRRWRFRQILSYQTTGDGSDH